MTGLVPRQLWLRTRQQACALVEQAPPRPGGGSQLRGAAPRRARPWPPWRRLTGPLRQVRGAAVLRS